MSCTMRGKKDDKASKISASKSDAEETKSSSDESVGPQPSDRKMAAKPTKTKTKTTKEKSLPKDPPNLDSNQVEVIQTVPASYPAKPARASKKLCMAYYKQKAHHYQRKY